jgi:hypothetical protein
VGYAEVLGRESGQTPVDPVRLIVPMLERFIATDRGFAKSRRGASEALVGGPPSSAPYEQIRPPEVHEGEIPICSPCPFAEVVTISPVGTSVDPDVYEWRESDNRQRLLQAHCRSDAGNHEQSHCRSAAATAAGRSIGAM